MPGNQSARPPDPASRSEPSRVADRVPPHRGVRLGVDVGAARIGVARSDPDGVLATPVCTVPVAGDPTGDGLEAIAGLVAEHTAYLVYVGLPLSLDGSDGPAARRIRDYATRLAGRIAPTRVRLVDERLTTVAAHRQLHDSGRRERSHRAVVDQAAAVLILQAALDAERATGREAGQPCGDRRGRPRRRGREDRDERT
ncbi:MAG: Holliday junction resolvase RuvX [Actinomycetales bacterium]|nr:MAG: Holliday junction resolvase RuvX [Actinomycetales bacterium]